MVGRSLLTATLVSTLGLAGAMAALAQPAGNNEIRFLSRCAAYVDRIDNLNRCEESLLAAAKLAPDVTRAFLAWCADHAQACEDRIVMVDRRNLVKAKWTCVIGARDSSQLSATAKSILAWLAQHPEIADGETDESVTAAVAALWPC